MEPADSTVSTSMWRIGQPASVWIRSVLPVIVPLTILVEDEYRYQVVKLRTKRRHARREAIPVDLGEAWLPLRYERTLSGRELGQRASDVLRGPTRRWRPQFDAGKH